MQTVTVINLKGGVGKTMTAVNTAAIIAGRGYKVLLIDADPQANATSLCKIDGSNIPGTKAILDCEVINAEDVIYQTAITGLDIVPSSIELVECDIAAIKGGKMIKLLRSFCDAAAESDYDFCFIDCPPGFSAASTAAIYASDEVLIPVKLDAFALDGLAALTVQINNLRRINPQIHIAGALITMWRNTPAMISGEELLFRSSIPAYRTKIRWSPKVDESTYMREQLMDYSPTCAAAQDYRKFADEFLEVSAR